MPRQLSVCLSADSAESKTLPTEPYEKPCQWRTSSEGTPSIQSWPMAQVTEDSGTKRMQLYLRLGVINMNAVLLSLRFKMFDAS